MREEILLYIHEFELGQIYWVMLRDGTEWDEAEVTISEVNGTKFVCVRPYVPGPGGYPHLSAFLFAIDPADIIAIAKSPERRHNG